MGHGIHVCSFSSSAAELKKSLRHENGVLLALKDYSRISTWDMSEKAWLRKIIDSLVKKGLIKEEDEPYPWHCWELTPKGEQEITT